MLLDLFAWSFLCRNNDVFWDVERANCKACRLDACIEAGMNPQGKSLTVWLSRYYAISRLLWLTRDGLQ